MQKTMGWQLFTNVYGALIIAEIADETQRVTMFFLAD
jgi:hypothetical protein